MWTKEVVIVAYKKLEERLEKLEKNIKDLKNELITLEEDKNFSEIELKVVELSFNKINLPIKRIEETIDESNGTYVRSWHIITKPIPVSLKDKLKKYSITPEGEEWYLIDNQHFDEEKQKFVKGPIPEEFYETNLYLSNEQSIRVKHLGYLNFILDGYFDNEQYWNVELKVKDVTKN